MSGLNAGRIGLGCVQSNTGLRTRHPLGCFNTNWGERRPCVWCASVIPWRKSYTDVFFSPSCPSAGARVFSTSCSSGAKLEFEQYCYTPGAAGACGPAPDPVPDQRAGAHPGSPGTTARGCNSRGLRSSLRGIRWRGLPALYSRRQLAARE